MERNAQMQSKRQVISEMADFLNAQCNEIHEYDDKLVRQLVERVEIYESYFTIGFKSGIKIEISL